MIIRVRNWVCTHFKILLTSQVEKSLCTVYTLYTKVGHIPQIITVTCAFAHDKMKEHKIHSLLTPGRRFIHLFAIHVVLYQQCWQYYSNKAAAIFRSEKFSINNIFLLRSQILHRSSRNRCRSLHSNVPKASSTFAIILLHYGMTSQLHQARPALFNVKVSLQYS